MQHTHEIICSLLPECDSARLVHHPAPDTFEVSGENYGPDGVEMTSVFFTRAQAHELHAWLGERLGLSHPAPTSPLTASRPTRNPRAEANDNPYRFDVV